MELVRLLASMRAHRRLILLVAIVAAGLGTALGATQSPTYEATSRIVLGPGEDIADHNDRIQVGQVLNHPVMAANLSEIITSDRVLADARWAADASLAEMEQVTVEAVIAPESNVIEVVVEGPEDDLVVELIAPLTAESVVLFEEIYPVFRAEVIDLAPAPEVVEPLGPVVGGIVGGFVGLVLAVFVALFVDAMHHPRPTVVRDRGPWIPRRVLVADRTPEHGSSAGAAELPPRPRVEASRSTIEPEMFEAKSRRAVSQKDRS